MSEPIWTTKSQWILSRKSEVAENRENKKSRIKFSNNLQTQTLTKNKKEKMWQIGEDELNFVTTEQIPIPRNRWFH